jgi:HSP20 family protein
MLVRVQRYPLYENPFGLFNFEHGIDQLFEEFLGSSVSREIQEYPAVDLAEYENESVLVAEMPGVKKEDVKVSLEGDNLTIIGVRKSRSLPEKSAWVRNEIGTGTFSRTIELPHVVNAGAVQAELNNGVLRVVLPKAEEVLPKEISVQ